MRLILSKLRAAWLVPVLLAIHWIVAVSSMIHKSPAYDETLHLMAGSGYWAYRDFRLHPNNGNLPQRWSTLPLFLMPNIKLPARDHPGWRGSDVSLLADDFLHKLGNPLEAMLFQGRAVSDLIALALALLVFDVSRRIWGDAGGLISLIFCLFCPTMLAHGPLITSDMSAAFFFFAATIATWRMLRILSCASFLLAALATGGLLLSKATAVILIPMDVLMIPIVMTGEPALQICLAQRILHVRGRVTRAAVLAAALVFCFALALVIVWSAYGFRYSAMNNELLGQGRFCTIPSLHALQYWITPRQYGPIHFVARHRLLPEAYIYGFGFVVAHLKRRCFFLGELGASGWMLYFPYCFLVKTPISLMISLPLAMIGVYKLSSARKLSSGGSARLSRDLAYKCAPLAVLATVFASIALGSSLNIGHRHILPIYPVLYVAAGGISSWAVLFPRRGALLVCLIMGCFLTSSATAYPHYLAYFNSFVPSNRAYKCLIDSNLDWGQDLPGLKSRLDSLLANGKVPVYLNYFGKGSPSYYGVRAIELPPKFDDLVPFRWEAGLYCVSATALQLGDEQSQRWTRAEEARYQELRRTYRGPCAMSTPTRDDDNIKPDLRKLRSQLEFGEFLRMMSYLRHREPDELVGYSILIFRLTEDEVALALRGNSEAVIEELR